MPHFLPALCADLLLSQGGGGGLHGFTLGFGSGASEGRPWHSRPSSPFLPRGPGASFRVTQYLGSDRGEHFAILMEYVAGGCIAGLLQNYGAFEDEVAQHYVRQVLFGPCPPPSLALPCPEP